MLLCVSALLIFAQVVASADVVKPVYSFTGELVFDGMSEAQCVDADSGARSELPMEGSPYTMEAWVMPEEFGHNDESLGIMGWGLPGHNQLNGFIFHLNSQSLRNIWWQNDLQANLAKPLADGLYHHVAATWDGKMQRLFVDYVEVASREASGYGVRTKENFCVGVAWHRDGSRAAFRGKIKDVRIWNVVRAVASDGNVNTRQIAQMVTRYRVHTKRGFLNIHSEPGDPFRMDNVIGRWLEGDVIDVIGETVETQFGPWVQTSKGWSIQVHERFHFLRPVDDPLVAMQLEKPVEEPTTMEFETPASPTTIEPRIPTASNDNEKLGTSPSMQFTRPGSSTSTERQNPSASIENAGYEGILSLQVRAREGCDDIDGQLGLVLSIHNGALGAALQGHFGFDKLWFVGSAKIKTDAGRQLRSGLAQASIDFRARGGADPLPNNTGLQGKVQDVFDAAGADLILRSVFVQWPAIETPLSREAGHKTCLLLFGAIALVTLSGLSCLGVVVCRRMKRAAKLTNTSDVEQCEVGVLGLPQKEIADTNQDNKEHAKGEDVLSESTADGGGNSEIGSSVSRATSGESLEAQPKSTAQTPRAAWANEEGSLEAEI